MTEEVDISLDYGMAHGGLSLPEDAYECQITDIKEEKTINKFNKKQQLGGMFTFEIIDGPHKGKQFTQFFTNKMTKRSKLTILCRAIWGQEFEPEETGQLQKLKDLKRFLLNKPLKVVLLIRHSVLSDSIWYDVAFFLKSEFYDEKVNKVILPK